MSAFREDLPPTPVDHDFMFEFPLGQDHIRVTLQPGTLNGMVLKSL